VAHCDKVYLDSADADNVVYEYTTCSADARKEVEGSGNNEVNRTEQTCAHIYIYI
jgi:hypothetical protein